MRDLPESAWVLREPGSGTRSAFEAALAAAGLAPGALPVALELPSNEAVRAAVEVLRARGVQRLEVTANPHAMEFYRSAGFTDYGTADTDFGAAPRMVLMLS